MAKKKQTKVKAQVKTQVKPEVKIEPLFNPKTFEGNGLTIYVYGKYAVIKPGKLEKDELIKKATASTILTRVGASKKLINDVISAMTEDNLPDLTKELADTLTFDEKLFYLLLGRKSDLDVLVFDPSAKVRVIVAKRGFADHVAILKNDENLSVRSVFEKYEQPKINQGYIL